METVFLKQRKLLLSSRDLLKFLKNKDVRVSFIWNGSNKNRYV